jgi:hypothetical protein
MITRSTVKYEGVGALALEYSPDLGSILVSYYPLNSKGICLTQALKPAEIGRAGFDFVDMAYDRWVRLTDRDMHIALYTERTSVHNDRFQALPMECDLEEGKLSVLVLDRERITWRLLEFDLEPQQKRSESCPECYQMVHHMREGKWPKNCPKCGRSTKPLEAEVEALFFKEQEE